MNFKKLLSVVLLSSIFVVSGCASWIDTPALDVSYPFPKGSYDEPESYERIDKFVTEEELASAIEMFPIEEIPMPNGSVVSKYDAISGNDLGLSFDFGFYKIASPVFGTSFENPDIIKYDDNGEPSVAINLLELSNAYSMDCRRAIEGDVLENGLVVDHACCNINKDGKLGTEVCLRGEVTLSGYLAYEFHPGHEKDPSNGTLWFIPDTTKVSVPTYFDPSHQYAYYYWGIMGAKTHIYYIPTAARGCLGALRARNMLNLIWKAFLMAQVMRL